MAHPVDGVASVRSERALLTGDVEICLGVGWPAYAVRRPTAVPAGIVPKGTHDHQRTVGGDLRPRHESRDEANVDAFAEPLVGYVDRTGRRLTVETHARAFQTGGVPRRHDDIRVRCGTNSTLLRHNGTASTQVIFNPFIASCSKLLLFEGPAPYWSNPPFLIFDIRALWRPNVKN